MPRLISEITADIYADWRKVYEPLAPYLVAMSNLKDITDSYGVNSASEIVQHFLTHAKTWRGETAQRIKEELKALLTSLQQPSDQP